MSSSYALDFLWTSILAVQHGWAFEIIIDISSPDTVHLMIPSDRQGMIPKLFNCRKFLIPKCCNSGLSSASLGKVDYAEASVRFVG